MLLNGVSRERTGLFLQALLKALWAFADGLPAEKASQIIASRIKLTEYERARDPDGGRRFDKILLSCTAEAVKAGWMRKNDHAWSITEKGKVILDAHPQLDELYRQVSRHPGPWRRYRKSAVRSSFQEVEARAWQEIQFFIEAMPPASFQGLVSALLHALGYVVGWTSPKGKDGGMAFLAWNGHEGECPPNIKVQVRRRREKVACEEMNAFLSSINGHEVGIFLATGGFTEAARTLAVEGKERQIELLNTKALVALWVKHHHKMTEAQRALLPLRPIYFISPLDGEGKTGKGPRAQHRVTVTLSEH